MARSTIGASTASAPSSRPATSRTDNLSGSGSASTPQCALIALWPTGMAGPMSWTWDALG